MAVAVEQFVEGLEQSGIISPSNLRAVREKLPPGHQQDAQELARELVRQKILTTYQVKEVYQGKAKNLVLGNYTILDQIGQGGMGQVFKAEHRRMHRTVAVKLLPTAMTKNQAALARFEREVTAAARLRHPNIVAADDADEANGVHFLVMEYVEGQDLSALVKTSGPIPVEQAVSYILQAARGLEFAHGEGVVHRDVKPANLLLDKKGVVKILDMGLARLDSSSGMEHTELTGTGQIMGTVDYMAPEQALNTKHADQRADIYSLGITLWYLLTGRAAFGGESVMEKLLAHREQPIPSLQAACAEATPALEAVFTKMVAKKVDDRFQSMSDVVVELERFRAEFSGVKRAPKAANARATDKPSAATKRRSSPMVEATLAMAGSQIETDPKTEQSLVVPAATRPIGRLRSSSARWKDWRIPPGRRTWVLTACASGAAALLLAGIVLYLEMRQGTVRIEINDPAIEVVVDAKGATIKGIDGAEEIKLQPGKHGLRIKYGELDFETDKFILNRADTITLRVELLDGKVQVVHGDTVLGEGPVPAIAPFDAKQALAHQEAWAKHIGTKVEIENSLGMKLQLIPPGEFLMGSPQAEIDALVQSTTDPDSQRCFRREGPRHGVKLTQAFYLGSCEVTQNQYQEVMGVNPSYFSLTGQGKDAVQDLETGQHPVETVSWLDAIDFCNKLSEREQRSPYYLRNGNDVKVQGGSGYRLPTEAEWEYACRAGTTTRWSFGDNETDLGKHAWCISNSKIRTHQVEGLAATPFGLYDMYGNVWEWCWDWHGEYPAGTVCDPTGSSAGPERLLRGGAFNGGGDHCCSAYRHVNPPTDFRSGSGFRVARTIDAKSEALPSAATDDSTVPASDTSPAAANVNPPELAIAPFDAKQAIAHQEAWAKHLGTKVEIENSLGMKLRLIPPGEFVMGSPQAEIEIGIKYTPNPDLQVWERSEGPQNRVKLTQAFYLGSCEVTQRQYQELMGVNPSHFSFAGPGEAAVKDLDTGEHPVDSVSWFDAIEFCNKLSAREQRSPYYARNGELVKVLGGGGYRLPTEAERECACRAGTTTRWSFGDSDQDLAQYAWFFANADGSTHRVGELLANPFGLYDLYGNVWEWCWDWFGSYTDLATDLTGPAVGSNRVKRGGAYADGFGFCRSATRVGFPPMRSDGKPGFRVARTIDVKSEELPPAATDDSAAPATDASSGAENANLPDLAITPFDADQALAHQEAWAKHLGTKVEIENSLGMKLRLIPPGEFLMGSPQDEIDTLVETSTDQDSQRIFRSEGPQHRVKLTQAFYLASCEVTQRQYQELMGVNRSHFSRAGAGKDAVQGLDTSQHPVEMVSWFDAIDFCNNLSEREQRPPYYLRDGEVVEVLRGTGYRLPTEAEWEYACRAGTTTRWSCGDDETTLVQHAWFRSNAGGTTHRVGGLAANPFGLYDLHGNVFELCWDWHGEYTAGAVSDPTGPASVSGRVPRGGAYIFFARFCRSSYHHATNTMHRDSYNGFRVTRTIDEQGEVLPPAATGGSAASANDMAPATAIVNAPVLAITPFDAKQALAHQEAWARHLGTKVEIENSLGMKLRLIPPGEFLMGSPQDDIDTLVQSTNNLGLEGAPKLGLQATFRREGPLHRVQISKAFFLGSCEVTQQQYQELMGVNPSHFSPTGPGKNTVQGADSHPVELVSWFDAIEFCNKLSEREQRPPYYRRDGDVVEVQGGTGYRLPTEAEWEYACRAGTTTPRSFGSTERDLARHAWFNSNAGGRTHPVASLIANPFGLHDMYGNVWEWCWDRHGEYVAAVVVDPTGPAAGFGRVLRGGEFNDFVSYCRSACRFGVNPTNRNFDVGFRVCCGH